MNLATAVEFQQELARLQAEADRLHNSLARLRAERDHWMHAALAHERAAADLRVRLMERPETVAE